VVSRRVYSTGRPQCGRLSANLPAGTVTFLFTDIEGSSALWEAEEAAMRQAVARHDALLRSVVESGGGAVFKTLGDGVLAVFPDARAALECALAVQAVVAGEPWPTVGRIRVRAALHSGFAEPVGGDYHSPLLNRLARVLGLATGGQTLATAATVELARSGPGARFEARFLGQRALRGIEDNLAVYAIGEPGRGANPTPTRGPLRIVGAWPDSGRPFVGREAEIADVLGRLASPSRRLVTVSGIGGVGKTRLSCQVAERAVDSYPDGVIWVDCAGMAHREEVAAAMLQGLEAADQDDGPEAAALGALRDRRTLVVLDCFERLTAHAGLVSSILDAAPEVRLLVTSRRLLGIEREEELALAPMAVGRRRPGEAEALFVALAQRSAPGFRLGRENQAAVSELCRLLEGLPLALSLAAARLRYSGVEDVLEQVRVSRLGLTAKSADVPARHSGLRQVIEDSLGLFGKAERALLADLSVFYGGFRPEDAAAVVGGKRDAVLAGLESLRDGSLVQTDHVGNRVRLRLLDSVREFFEDEGSHRLVERHAEHYAGVAEGLAARFEAGRWAEASATVRNELPNLRQAVATSARLGRTDLVARLARSLARALLEAGYWADYDALSAAAADVPDDDRLRALMLGLDGARAARAGRQAAATVAWQERAVVCRQIGDRAGAIDATLDLAEAERERGRLEAARRYAVTGLLEARATGHGALAATALAVLAETALAQGRQERARHHARAALRLADATDELDLVLYVHKATGRVFRALGDEEKGRDGLTRLVSLAWQSNRLHQVVNGLMELAPSLAEPELSIEAHALAAELAKELGARRADEARRALAAASSRTGLQPSDEPVADRMGALLDRLFAG
jgi:predicted ATPase/class 3 adenylate cyclase